MYNVLSKPRKSSAVLYIKIAGKEYFVCRESFRKARANLSKCKYNFESLSKAHSLIKEKINTKY